MRRRRHRRDVGAMKAFMLAVFPNHAAAEAVRVALFTDGFPTDRLDVTSLTDEGPALVAPNESRHGRLQAYFESLFDDEDAPRLAAELAGQVEEGAAALTVHPRGDIEIARATEIVTRARPVLFETRDLDKQTFERAASPSNQSIVGQTIKVVTGLDAESVGLSRKP